MTSVRIGSGNAQAVIALQGAELRNWTVDGTPLLWAPDPTIWPETAPILFPVVGWTRGSCVTVGGTTYPLGLHGFARSCEFKVLEHWPSHVRLELISSAETEAIYPFHWSLQVEYAIDGACLETRLTVHNRGDGSMPYACGLHPGFRWPFAGGELTDYMITFAERESAQVPMISNEGLFTHQTRRIPIDGRRLELSEALFAQEALCFIGARSRSVRFAHSSGAAIDIGLENFPHIALWSRPEGRFLCIEAWTGHGDFVDADGDLLTKQSIRHLQPGTTGTHATKFSFAAPHLLLR